MQTIFFVGTLKNLKKIRHRSFWIILATVGGVRKWTHRGHLEHGGEGEVALLRVNDKGEGRRGDVSEGAHDGER